MTASANPRRRLASRTSSDECVPGMQNSFKTTFNGIRERPDRRSLMPLLSDFHHQRRR